MIIPSDLSSDASTSSTYTLKCLIFATESVCTTASFTESKRYSPLYQQLSLNLVSTM